MGKMRDRKLHQLMKAAGIISPEPPPPRVLTVVAVPFFATDDEFPSHIEAYRAMVTKSQYGVLVSEPAVQHVVGPEDAERHEAFLVAYQAWLCGPGSESNAEPPAAAYERLRLKFRTWTPPSQAA